MALIKGKQIDVSPNGIDTANINPAAVTGAKVNAEIIKADGTNPFTAAQSMGNNKLTNVATPTVGGDAANKSYVDAAINGVTVKAPVLVVATANVAIAGEQTIDGVLTNNSRVLLTAQAVATQNGFWVTAAGAWTRPADFAAGSSAAGALTVVEEGTANADTQWICTTDPPNDIVDTNNLAFVKFANPFTYTFGNGLQQVGSTVSVKAADASINVAAGGVSTNFAAPTDVGVANAAGVAVSSPRSDHVHNSPINAVGVSDVACSVTVADGDAATATTVPKNNFGTGKLNLFINGVFYPLGNGVKTKAAYISGDGGATARAWGAVVAGDTIRWNGSIAGFQLAASDRLDLNFLAFT